MCGRAAGTAVDFPHAGFRYLTPGEYPGLQKPSHTSHMTRLRAVGTHRSSCMKYAFTVQSTIGGSNFSLCHRFLPRAPGRMP